MTRGFDLPLVFFKCLLRGDKMANNHNHHEVEEYHSKLKGEEKEKAVAAEMFPFLFYAAIPIIITLAIAKIFGPTV
jgi:hypothetical protein